MARSKRKTTTHRIPRTPITNYFQRIPSGSTSSAPSRSENMSTVSPSVRQWQRQQDDEPAQMSQPSTSSSTSILYTLPPLPVPHSEDSTNTDMDMLDSTRAPPRIPHSITHPAPLSRGPQHRIDDFYRSARESGPDQPPHTSDSSPRAPARGGRETVEAQHSLAPFRLIPQPPNSSMTFSDPVRWLLICYCMLITSRSTSLAGIRAQQEAMRAMDSDQEDPNPHLPTNLPE
jgi:hypothetical protein